ncbi:DUF1501 domain-containing protein [Frigoriglobus tundricola]|uniref:DUF1501 domain-containing protein n=1 Tax=Frigoriglobus tundricola TaxID=2774151 RepID=A0A6M5Z381_9BACT|nr:DUF1501 domain-containing protein [Frigoriglobus tundricola]QJW99891.1 Protein of unknown function (DUF1501) [Frigoriglobus tundricola]
MLTRRSLLKSAPLLSLAPTVPAFLMRTARAAGPKPDARALVVVQLDGGNDALNTVVPFADPDYAKLRPKLKLDPKGLVKLNDAVGLHPALKPLDKLWAGGRLAVLPGVGYPNPNRSHFESMAIWHTARFDNEEARTSPGWIGRALDAGGGESCVVAPDAPRAVRGRRASIVTLTRAEDLLLSDPVVVRAAVGAPTKEGDLLAFVRRQAADATAGAEQVAAKARNKSDAEYPATGLGQKLQLVARMLKAGFLTRVYYTSQSGYDTHAQQGFAHRQLLDEFAGAVSAFFADLAAAKLDDRVALVAFSEFGRTIKENGSLGTDHGTAGCVFVAGGGVKGGVRGTQPSLTVLVGGEPEMTTDFRAVYSAVLTDWLTLPADGLGGTVAPVKLFG